VPALFWDIEHLEIMPHRGSSTVTSVLIEYRVSRDNAASGGSLGRGDMYGVSVLVGCRASRDDAASGWQYGCQRSGKISSIS
jgi:hypothetical protein